SLRVSQAVRMTVPIQTDAQGNVTGTLPPLSPGLYSAIVHANVRASIRELDLTNNEGVSAPTMQADVAALTLGTPSPTAFSSTDQTHFYKVAVPAGQDLLLSLTSDVTDATNEMFLAFNRTPTLTDYDFSGPSTFTSHPSILVPGTQAGTYFVMLVPRSLGSIAAQENLSLVGNLLPFQVSSVAPAAGGQGLVSVHVHGAGLREPTVIRLEQSGIPVASGELRKFINTSETVVRFDLSAVPLGSYDVVAQNGTDIVSLPGAFTVETAIPGAISVLTHHADVLRRTATGTFEVTFHNSSNLDVPILKARILYPASSTLRSLTVDPGLLRRSDRASGLIAPLTGDVFVMAHSGGPDSIAAVDLVGSNFSPGEDRVATLGLAGFETSPFSVRVLS